MEDEISDWGEGLPNHLLDYCIERFDSSKDVLQFGSVCRNWRLAAKDSSKAKHRVASDTPMLLIGDENDKHALWAFDVSAGRYLSSKLSVPYGKRFGGSSRGWLAAVNSDWSVTLHKPSFSSSPITSTAAVVLPPVYPPPAEGIARVKSMGYPGLSIWQHYHLCKLVISADPVENRDECVVVASVKGMHDLAVFRVGRDSSWSKVTCPGAMFPQDLMLLRGTSRVYAVGAHSDIRYIDLDHMERDSVIIRSRPDPVDRRSFNNYLVQAPDSDTTYIVRRFFKKRPPWKVNSRNTSEVQVFVLDLATGECEKVTSIGDNSMFLGDSESLCIKASGCYLPNCIYFTHDSDLENTDRHEICDIGIYDIQAEQFKERRRIPESTYQAMGRRPPIFVLPPLIF